MEADAEADFVQDFVGVFGVDPVFDGAGAGEGEAGGRELDDVGEGYLGALLVLRGFTFNRIVYVLTYQDVHLDFIFDCERAWSGRPNLSARRLEQGFR